MMVVGVLVVYRFTDSSQFQQLLHLIYIQYGRSQLLQCISNMVPPCHTVTLSLFTVYGECHTPFCPGNIQGCQQD